MTRSGSHQLVLPMRRWLALALVTVFVVPVLVTVIFAAAWVREEPQYPIENAVSRLRHDTAQWSDPAWQEGTAAEFARNDIDIVLYSGGTEIFRTADDPIAGDPASQATRVVERVIIADSDPRLSALVYANERMGPPEGVPVRYIPFVALGTLALTLAGIAFFLRRTILGPLAAMSDAARQIARGDLEIALPGSRVREVAEVGAAFEAMGEGLRESLRQQAALEEERRFFIGAVAHDLRTPLFSLRGYLDGLRGGVADTEARRQHYLNVAQVKADALEYLIAELFEFTRLEYLDQQPAKEPISMSDLLKVAVEGMKPLAQEKPVSIRLNLPDGEATLRGDARLLTRVIDNLLENAIRHTPADGSIDVTCKVSDQDVVVIVADTGPGIPTSDLSRIFSPMFRGEDSRNRGTGGAGLGLTIARRIVRAHGGELSVSDRTAGGAEFTATLPRT